MHGESLDAGDGVAPIGRGTILLPNWLVIEFLALRVDGRCNQLHHDSSRAAIRVLDAA